jgi:hypothetical protein
LRNEEIDQQVASAKNARQQLMSIETPMSVAALGMTVAIAAVELLAEIARQLRVSNAIAYSSVRAATVTGIAQPQELPEPTLPLETKEPHNGKAQQQSRRAQGQNRK